MKWHILFLLLPLFARSIFAYKKESKEKGNKHEYSDKDLYEANENLLFVGSPKDLYNRIAEFLGGGEKQVNEQGVRSVGNGLDVVVDQLIGGKAVSIYDNEYFLASLLGKYHGCFEGTDATSAVSSLFYILDKSSSFSLD